MELNAKHVISHHNSLWKQPQFTTAAHLSHQNNILLVSQQSILIILTANTFTASFKIENKTSNPANEINFWTNFLKDCHMHRLLLTVQKLFKEKYVHINKRVKFSNQDKPLQAFKDIQQTNQS